MPLTVRVQLSTIEVTSSTAKVLLSAVKVPPGLVRVLPSTVMVLLSTVEVPPPIADCQGTTDLVLPKPKRIVLRDVRIVGVIDLIDLHTCLTVVVNYCRGLYNNLE
jgi:hypothetical protein